MSATTSQTLSRDDRFIFRASIDRVLSRHEPMKPPRKPSGDLCKLSPEDQRLRRREWNRGPMTDLFPRISFPALERILDIAVDKGFTYNLSLSKSWNAKRYSSIVVAHVRHFYSDYDRLLSEGVERFEARRRSGPQVWTMLREWCPWDSDNQVLRQCFEATLLPPDERDPSWDPMDIDEDDSTHIHAPRHAPPSTSPRQGDPIGDPMDLD